MFLFSDVKMSIFANWDIHDSLARRVRARTLCFGTNIEATSAVEMKGNWFVQITPEVVVR